MRGATPPLPHMPSWYTQRQLHFAFFLAELHTLDAIWGMKGQSVRPNISDPKSLFGFLYFRYRQYLQSALNRYTVRPFTDSGNTRCCNNRI